MVRLRKPSTLAMHITKHKNGTRGQQRHNERKEGQKHRNRNIDPTRTKDNVWLTPDDGKTFNERIQSILEENYTGKRKPRWDSVKMCEITVQIGGDLAENGTEEEQVEALKQAFEELKETYGETNIVSAVIHVDETTPHLHFDFVPITRKGGLSAREVVGDRAQMRKTQARFLEAMQERCPECKFERKKDGAMNGMEQKLFETMTAALRTKETELWDREEEVEDREIKVEEQENQLNALQATLQAKEQALIARERHIEKAEDGIVFDRDEITRKEHRLSEHAQELREQEEAIAETASKLAEKTRELNLKTEDLDGREEALKRAEGLAEARRAQELENARKEAERIREDAREEAKGIIARASEMVEKAKEVLRKIPLVNKMMIGWAEKQGPEDRQATEDVLDAMTKYGVEEPKEAFVESEDEQEQRDNLELLQAVTMLTEDDMDEAKETAEAKGELSREDVHDILQGMQDLHDDGWQQ
ncbi:MobV family relaxase [Abiotrophia defectiva]|uniref:MobV family relaxase n=1 Tax=Abiotrophia defectiva TaxID=46125 RepID=UPI0034CDCBD9